MTRIGKIEENERNEERGFGVCRACVVFKYVSSLLEYSVIEELAFCYNEEKTNGMKKEKKNGIKYVMKERSNDEKTNEMNVEKRIKRTE